MRRRTSRLIPIVFLATCLALSLTCFKAGGPDTTVEDGTSAAHRLTTEAPVE